MSADLIDLELDLMDDDIDACRYTGAPIDMQRMAREIKRHRAAKAADASRIRDVVLDATHKEFAGKYDDETIQHTDWTAIQHAIADRCVDQLAAPSAQPAQILIADDLRLIDQALGVLTSDYNDVPHDDIARIRKILAAEVKP